MRCIAAVDECSPNLVEGILARIVLRPPLGGCHQVGEVLLVSRAKLRIPRRNDGSTLADAVFVVLRVERAKSFVERLGSIAHFGQGGWKSKLQEANAVDSEPWQNVRDPNRGIDLDAHRIYLARPEMGQCRMQAVLHL